MHLNPSENRQLFGMNSFFFEMINLYNKKNYQIKFYCLVKGDWVNQH